MKRVPCFKNKARKVNCKFQNLVLSASLALGASVCTMSAYAAPNAKNAITQAISVLGKVICIPGVVYLILGIVHYAAANTEGDGPAKHKAIQQISGGAMVVAVGVMMVAGVFSSIINALY